MVSFFILFLLFCVPVVCKSCRQQEGEGEEIDSGRDICRYTERERETDRETE